MLDADEQEDAQHAAVNAIKRKKMAVLPPDPLFRFKSDLGHLHTLCFLEGNKSCLDANVIEENLQNLAITDRKQLLVTAGEAGIVYFFDLEVIHTYGNRIILQEKGGFLLIFHRQSNPSDEIYEKIDCLQCASGFCKSLQPANHRDLLLIPQENATVDIYSLREKTTLRKLAFDGCNDLTGCLHDPMTSASLGQMMCMEVGQVGRGQEVVFVAFETGDVFMWDFTSGQLLSHVKFNECAIAMAYDSASGRGVIGGAGPVLQVFAVDRRTCAMRALCEISLTNPGCQALRVRPDGKIMVAGGCDGRTRIYSWKTLRLLAALTENHAGVTDVQFSREVVPLWGSQIMAVCGADGVITLWNLYK